MFFAPNRNGTEVLEHMRRHPEVIIKSGTVNFAYDPKYGWYWQKSSNGSGYRIDDADFEGMILHGMDEFSMVNFSQRWRSSTGGCGDGMGWFEETYYLWGTSTYTFRVTEWDGVTSQNTYDAETTTAVNDYTMTAGSWKTTHPVSGWVTNFTSGQRQELVKDTNIITGPVNITHSGTYVDLYLREGSSLCYGPNREFWLGMWWRALTDTERLFLRNNPAWLRDTIVYGRNYVPVETQRGKYAIQRTRHERAAAQQQARERAQGRPRHKVVAR